MERKPARRLIGLLIIVAVMGAALFLVRHQPAQRDPGTGTQLPWPLRGLLFSPPTDEAAASDGATVALAPDPITVDVCGVGRLVIKEPNDVPVELRRQFQRMEALTRAIVELGAKAEPSDRAIALRFEALLAAQRATSAVVAGSRDCENNEQCMAAAEQIGEQAGAPFLQALAQLADENRDPVALVLAYNVCRKPSQSHPQPCDRLTATRWTELDPDNGAAWMELANEAARRNDEAVRAQAMARAAAATHFNLYMEQLFRPLDNAGLRDAGPVERLAAQLLVTGVVAAVPLSYQETTRYCDNKVLGDPQRRTQCDRLATLLVETDTTLIGHSIGTHLGELVGWPAERIAALKEEHDAINAAASSDMQPQDFLTCESLQFAEQRSADMLRYGEHGSFQRAIERSGRSRQDLAREWRERVRRAGEDDPRSQQK